MKKIMDWMYFYDIDTGNITFGLILGMLFCGVPLFLYFVGLCG